MPRCDSPLVPAQITSFGRSVQAKTEILSIESLATEGIGRIAEKSAQLGVAEIAGLYVHIPFCFHKCHYCDFYSIVDSHDRQEVFVNRLIDELVSAAMRYIHNPIQTIFIGGGTPTLLAPPLWTRLLKTIQSHLRWQELDRREFTVEANPETVTAELVDVLVDGGVNRVSIGCQTFHAKHLKTLERWHDPANVNRSVGLLRAGRIENINLDLIFAIPGQTLAEWETDLDRALALQPQHLSCYSLMYEPNTPLTKKMKAGLITPADQDLEAAMYELTLDKLAAAGFAQYEISNWSLPGKRCRHNMLYWTNANWWPLGPSASGHVNGLRWKNVPRLGEYLDHGPLPPIVDVECLDDDARRGEELMLRLRLNDGVSMSQLEALLDSESGQRRRAAMERHRSAGHLDIFDDHLCLTRQGLLVADSVVADLL